MHIGPMHAFDIHPFQHTSGFVLYIVKLFRPNLMIL